MATRLSPPLSRRTTLGEITDKRYGDTPFTPSFSSNNTESPVRFEIADTTIARLENGKIVIVKSGTTSLKAYQEESALFSAGESEALDFTIGKAPLSVSVANAVRIEGEENPEFELSFSGFINGEDTSCLDVLPTASCEADALSPGGYYHLLPRRPAHRLLRGRRPLARRLLRHRHQRRRR